MDILLIAKLTYKKNADSIVYIGGLLYSNVVKIARLLYMTFPKNKLSEELIESLVN